MLFEPDNHGPIAGTPLLRVLISSNYELQSIGGQQIEHEECFGGQAGTLSSGGRSASLFGSL
jgi:hypothetical protein